MRQSILATASTVILILATACGGGGGGGGPSSGSLTVTGRVVSAFGGPLANIAVVVDGQGPIVTDPNGDFVFTGVRVPYEAIVFDGTAGDAVVWQGLTRADPTFTYTGSAGGIVPPTSSATVSGIISGGVGFPIPAPPPDIETEVNLWVDAGDVFGSASATPNTVTGAYTENSLEWPGIAPFTLTITALQFTTDGAGLPVSFTGFGQLTTPISNGAALVGQNIGMSPVTTTTISGTTSIPPSVTTLSRVVFLRYPGGGFEGLPSETGGGPNFTFQAPSVTGLTRSLLTFGVTAASDTVFHVTDELPAPATGLAVTLPDVAGPVLPVNGVTGVDYTTPFTTAPSPDSVYRVEFSPNGGGMGPEIQLVTTETTFTIPDLSAYGLAIPAGAQYDWEVRAQGPATAVDDLAVPPDFGAGIFIGLLGSGEQFGTSSASRSFFFVP